MAKTNKKFAKKKSSSRPTKVGKFKINHKGGSLRNASSMRGGYSWSVKPAPVRDEGIGMSMSARFSPFQLYKRTDATYPLLYDGLAFARGFSVNPLVSSTNVFLSLLGGTPVGNIVKLFQYYTVTKLTMHYVPTAAYSEAGSFAVGWRSDMDIASITNYAAAKNISDSAVFPANRPFSFTFMHHRGRELPRLYHVDPSLDTTTNKLLCNPGVGAFFSDVLSSNSDVIMGDLVFEIEMQMYGLQNNTAPTACVISTGVVTSSSTSSASSSSAKSTESKEAKTTIDDSYQEKFLMVKQQSGNYPAVRAARQ